MGKLNWHVRDRLRRWLWRYPDERLHGHYGLWPLPPRAAWKSP